MTADAITRSSLSRKPESSRFLKATRALASPVLAELAAVAAGGLSVSDGPVELRFGDGELAAVGFCLGPAGPVAPWVAEDPAWEHDECLGGGTEVGVPGHWLVVESCGAGLSVCRNGS